MSSIIGLKPQEFVHILDLNTNIVDLELGPKTIVLQSNQKLVCGPLPMVVVPPGKYCVIIDPCSKYVPGLPPKLKIGQTQVKFHQVPFPLYPGESLKDAPDLKTVKTNYGDAIKSLPVVKANHAIRLLALLDCEDKAGKHNAGERWQIRGPLTYHPQAEVEMEGIQVPLIIHENEALRLRALQSFKDKDSVERVTGEEWMVYESGAYLPGVYEEVVKLEKKITLTPDIGLKLQALQTIKDRKGTKRLAGEEWLITGEQADEYFPEIGVQVVSQEKKIVLKKGQYVVVINPVDKNLKPQLGFRELRVGCMSFFLHPGEELEKGKIQSAYILAENEALLLQADEAFVDKATKGNVTRKAGDKWMIRGPVEYIPNVNSRVVKKRTQIPLSKNEGIYVQDLKTGQVRAVMGPQSYMLSANEELWSKELPDETERLLRQGGGSGSGDIRKMAYFEQCIDPQLLSGRDKTKVVTFRCPGNTAVQVYNYSDKSARVIFGPDLVILGPQENFNVLHLSAGKPKKEDAMQSLCLMLGPDFITDIIEVETSDHARLRIQLAFNNYFEFERGNDESEKKIFSVPDFIGFACRQIGSRIRGTVARIPFDEFHKHSSSVIHAAVFGMDQGENFRQRLKFSVNNLVISGIDIQSIEPSDMKMRDSLSKSVQLAIEISTKSIEAAASHEASRNEQIAKGELERQKLYNEKESEKERAKLLELQAIAAAVESTGQAKAEAQAQAERIIIECESEIEIARLKAEAESIVHCAELEKLQAARGEELSYSRSMNELDLHKQKTFANIEVEKFKKMVDSIGPGVIQSMAAAGPANQVNLLKSLGLDSVLITDGNNPINLFNTAEGLVGGKPK